MSPAKKAANAKHARNSRPKSPNTGLRTIRAHIKARGAQQPLKTVSAFMSRIHETSARWQREDWEQRQATEGEVLNPVRIVGQTWFRGQRNVSHGLQPGLYREATRKNLEKAAHLQPTSNHDDHLFAELFDLEHELRIDFTSFGHLLNEGNHAKSAIDWYFLMQHHGLPTRLLDWTTNALAALFFAAESYRSEVDHANKGEKPSPIISVWMMDAYWLALKLSDDWSSPVLAWSEDAEKYVPKLETMVDRASDSKALIPEHAMPIEPPAMHPRVASQEGRFVIFGKRRDLLDEEVRLDHLSNGYEELRLEQIKIEVADVDDLLQDLAQLGVSRRTLFPDLAGLADFIYWKHFHKVRGYEQ